MKTSLLLYIGISLVLVLAVLAVYYATGVERKTHASRLGKATERFRTLFDACIASGDYHLPEREVKRLKHTIDLEAFHQACKSLDEEQCRRILLENQDPIIELQQREQNTTVHAFFAYLLRDLDLSREKGGKYGDLMAGFLHDSSVYARENALKALYSFGDAGEVADALISLSDRGIPHNEKLLLDGLLSFRGDAEELVERLMARYDSLIECYRNALINYLGHKAIDRYDGRLLEDAQKEGADIDTVCAIIRKMNRTPSERNLQFLESLIERYRNANDWEPVAIAATGLGRYGGNDSVKALLKTLLLSHNWYIRKNAASSLVSIGVTQEDLDEIVAQNDRFAADAIRYEMGRTAHV